MNFPPPRRRLGVLAMLAALLFVGFAALGTWQLFRLQWKQDLIARVEQRVHQPAVAAPGPGEWGRVNPRDHEYLRVRAEGVYLPELATRVQASTELGSGYWLMVPLKTAGGDAIWINRGFVSPDPPGAPRRTYPAPDGVQVVTGLLRTSQQEGGFLRKNDPANDRWYSRDVQAIGKARGMDRVAPYFIDADARPSAEKTEPVGGLTVIAFANNHLGYALTWYSMAAAVAGLFIWLARGGGKMLARDDAAKAGEGRDG